jgi:hypothetical protein
MTIIEDHRVSPDDVGTGRFRKLRAMVRARCQVPDPVEGEPSDDDLLRYLDGVMERPERVEFERRLAGCPNAQARVEILAAALEECGWSPAKDDTDLA